MLLARLSGLLAGFRFGSMSGLRLFIKAVVTITETTITTRIGIDIVSFLFSADILSLYILPNEVFDLIERNNFFLVVQVAMRSALDN